MGKGERRRWHWLGWAGMRGADDIVLSRPLSFKDCLYSKKNKYLGGFWSGRVERSKRYHLRQGWNRMLSWLTQMRCQWPGLKVILVGDKGDWSDSGYILKEEQTGECMLSHFSHVWLFATLWTVAHQIPLSMAFSKNAGVGCHALLQRVFPI